MKLRKRGRVIVGFNKTYLDNRMKINNNELFNANTRNPDSYLYDPTITWNTVADNPTMRHCVYYYICTNCKEITYLGRNDTELPEKCHKCRIQWEIYMSQEILRKNKIKEEKNINTIESFITVKFIKTEFDIESFKKDTDYSKEVYNLREEINKLKEQGKEFLNNNQKEDEPLTKENEKIIKKIEDKMNEIQQKLNKQTEKEDKIIKDYTAPYLFFLSNIRTSIFSRNNIFVYGIEYTDNLRWAYKNKSMNVNSIKNNNNIKSIFDIENEETFIGHTKFKFIGDEDVYGKYNVNSENTSSHVVMLKHDVELINSEIITFSNYNLTEEQIESLLDKLEKI